MLIFTILFIYSQNTEPRCIDINISNKDTERQERLSEPTRSHLQGDNLIVNYEENILPAKSPETDEPTTYAEDTSIKNPTEFGEITEASTSGRYVVTTGPRERNGVTPKYSIAIVATQSTRRDATARSSTSHLSPAQIRKVVIMVIISGTFSVTFIVALAFGYVFALRNFKDYSSTSDIVLMFSFYRFYFINYAINPVIYFSLDRYFRREVMKVVFCSKNR